MAYGVPFAIVTNPSQSFVDVSRLGLTVFVLVLPHTNRGIPTNGG
jgi:hypothetical protein